MFLPIYIRGWIKFWNHRKHILIEKRFPLICCLISTLSFISGTFGGILLWIHYHTENPRATPEFSSGISYLVYGFINLRLTLVYIRWKKNKQFLAHLNLSLSKNPSNQITLSMSMNTPTIERKNSDSSESPFAVTDKYQKRSIYNNCPCLSLIIFTLIGSGWITFGPSWTRTYGMITGPLWMIQIFITIILICIVLCNRVKDGIGCLKETIINLSVNLLIVILFPFTFIGDHITVPLFIVFNFAPYLQGLIPLYGGLYYVQKMDGIQVTTEQNKQQSESTNNTDNIIAENECDEDNEILNDVQQPLTVFMRKYKNYEIFREYLSHCWAVENLLFLQNVIILRQIVLKCKGMVHGKSTDLDENRNENDSKRESGSNEHVIEFDGDFEYLSAIYMKYNKKLGIKSKNMSNTNGVILSYEELKDKLFKIHQEIYYEFVATDSINQINISFENRASLELLLKNESHCDKFKSFDDFYHLYDGAIVEVFQLILSMYHYKFKKYVQTTIIQNKPT